MYRIKPNGNYILLIKDLGITLTFDNDRGVDISDEQFDSSVDIKKILRYLIVEKLDETTANVKQSPKKEIKDSSKSDVFIAHEQPYKVPDDVFVANAEEEVVTKKNIKDKSLDVKETKEVLQDSDKTVIEEETTKKPKKNGKVVKSKEE